MPSTPRPSLSRKEQHAADRYERINAKAPVGLRQAVANALLIGLSGKQIEMMPTDTLADVVRRECPEVEQVAAAEGYRANFDLPANTRANMAKGNLFFTLVKIDKAKFH